MGKQIELEAKQIILKVIQFCEEEKKNGLLAPRHQAIRRACLATGLSKYTILKLRNEAKNAASGDGYTWGDDDEMLESDSDEAPGLSIGSPLRQSNTNEQGSQPTSMTMETVVVKMEQEDKVEKEGACDPRYYFPIKAEPVDDYNKEGGPTTTVLKCEFQSTGDPLLPNNERLKHEGPTQEGGEPEEGKESAEIMRVLQTHQLQKDSLEDKQYQCSICHQCFSRSDTLTAHYNQHISDKPYTCNVCQRQFTHRTDLRRHLITHKAKAFECNLSQSHFSQNALPCPRLDRSLNHFPERTEDTERRTLKSNKLKRMRCVRCLARKTRTMSSIFCSHCKVFLCVGRCWTDYHTLPSL